MMHSQNFLNHSTQQEDNGRQKWMESISGVAAVEFKFKAISMGGQGVAAMIWAGGVPMHADGP